MRYSLFSPSLVPTKSLASTITISSSLELVCPTKTYCHLPTILKELLQRASTYLPRKRLLKTKVHTKHDGRTASTSRGR